jgi:hypothetical protein
VDESRDRLVDGVEMRGNGSHERPVDRVTVPEAAEMLGVSQSAVRKRIQRGTIPWDKDDEGRVYVYLDPSETGLGAGKDRFRDRSPGQSRDELLESYREQIDFLRQELERKDTIIIGLTHRIPELVASPEPRESDQGSTERTVNDNLSERQQQESPRRPSWLYRFFFGPQ